MRVLAHFLFFLIGYTRKHKHDFSLYTQKDNVKRNNSKNSLKIPDNNLGIL